MARGRTESARTDIKPSDAGTQLSIFKKFPVATDRLKLLLSGEALKRTVAVVRNPQESEETRLQAMLTLRNAKLIDRDYDFVQKTLQRLAKLDPNNTIRSAALEAMCHQRDYMNQLFASFTCMGSK